MSFQYQAAGKILGEVMKKKGGIKKLLYSSASEGKKKIYALVCETLRYKEVLDEVLESVDSSASIHQVREKNTLYVMLYDFLLGKKKIQGGGAVKRAVGASAAALAAAWAGVRAQRAARHGPGQLLPASRRRRTGRDRPRYARVNTLKLEMAQAVQNLTKEGYVVVKDPHVSDLLQITLPEDEGPENGDPATSTTNDKGEPSAARLDASLAAHPMVVRGELVLQDKASCFPVQCLREAGWPPPPPPPGPGGPGGGRRHDAVDACAAPGNKTTQLAALVAAAAAGGEGGGRVFAFDKSPDRLEVLRRRVGEAGADGVAEALLRDFLEVSPSDPALQRVSAVLLDPSCSGSGMPDQYAPPEEGGGGGAAAPAAGKAKERIEKLAAFQLEALKKAMSFPQVEIVSYSTCSIHVKENEGVVAAALASEEGQGWELLPALRSWPRRGVPADAAGGGGGGGGGGLCAAAAAKVVRATPEDGTHGFFVALLARSGCPWARGPAAGGAAGDGEGAGAGAVDEGGGDWEGGLAQNRNPFDALEDSDGSSVGGEQNLEDQEEVLEGGGDGASHRTSGMSDCKLAMPTVPQATSAARLKRKRKGSALSSDKCIGDGEEAEAASQKETGCQDKVDAKVLSRSQKKNRKKKERRLRRKRDEKESESAPGKTKNNSSLVHKPCLKKQPDTGGGIKAEVSSSSASLDVHHQDQLQQQRHQQKHSVLHHQRKTKKKKTKAL